MKKLSILFALFLLLQFNSLAQEGWFWQNPLPQGNNIRDIHVIDENNAIAVGENTILRTTNGGEDWLNHPDGKYYNLNSVHFSDDNNGWAVGPELLIIKTTNGGEDWEEVENNPNFYHFGYSSVFFIDSNIGWIIQYYELGKVLLKTTNGGLDFFWQEVGYLVNVQSVYFIDENIGWVGCEYEDSIYWTTNGGDDWTGSPINNCLKINSLCFVDANIGWAVGINDDLTASLIYKTTDGGLNWSLQFSDSTIFFDNICFTDSNIGWVSGEELLKTTNGGDNWFVQSDSGGTVDFINSNTGWLVGRQNYNIRKSTNGGEEWIYQSSSITNENLYSIHFINNDIGWAVGDEGEILKTTNSGELWFSQESNTTIPLNSIYCINDQYGCIVGGSPNDTSIIILHTADGGTNWINQSTPITEPLYSVIFMDEDYGWAVGEDGAIIKTTNGGELWFPQVSGTTSDLKSVYFINHSTGWTVGYPGTILKTTNGGDLWFYQPGPGGVDIKFIDEFTGWCVAEHSVYRTTNGGVEWVEQFSTQFTNFAFLNSVCAIDENFVWIAGYDSLANFWGGDQVIYRSTNGGDDWQPQVSGTERYLELHSIHFTNVNSGWSVGDAGTILHTIDGGGVTFIEENEIYEIATDYYFSNNFPNPFNPNTKIRYSIPQASKVTIKVFDILGNEIETLVNEEKPVGTYEINWYAEELPSGVYFYRLQAGDFVETKKMVLLK